MFYANIKGFLAGISICIQALASPKAASIFLHQPKTDTTTSNGEVIVNANPESKDAIFEKNGAYTLNLKSTFNTDQSGQISYEVLTESGERVSLLNKPITLHKKSSDSYHFDLPEMKSGFYKINFMVNLTDYDDTVRRVFGVSPKDIAPTSAKPADFDAFWKNTREELEKVKPDFKMIEQPAMEKEGYKVYLLQMQSLDGLTIRCWYTEPVKKGKHAVYVYIPGLQQDMQPMYGDPDFASLIINVRGKGNSRDVVRPDIEDYITYHLKDKNTYIFRGAIMDCIRGIDFIASRPELDSKSIIVSGASTGGYLAIALAALDHRIALCSAKTPVFSNFKTLFKETEWPGSVMKRYCMAVMHGDMKKMMSNLEYFDCRNFAESVTCNVSVGMGLLDFLSPPANLYEMYNQLHVKTKKLFIYPDLSHEVGANYQTFEYKWAKDEFGLYN